MFNRLGEDRTNVLELLANKYAKSGYGEYLLTIVAEKQKGVA